jgi:hypothetical protein
MLEQDGKIEALTNLVKEWYPENTMFEKDGKVYERTCEGINEKGKLIIRTRERPELQDWWQNQMKPLLDQKQDVTPEEKQRVLEVVGKAENLREKLLPKTIKEEDEEDEIVKEEAEDENE